MIRAKQNRRRSLPLDDRAAIAVRRRGTAHVGGLAVIVALSAVLTLSGCQPSMRDQPRVKVYEEADFFPDRVGIRPLPEGTVPQDARVESGSYDTGREQGEFIDELPKELEKQYPATPAGRLALLQRGQERYNIYCSMCHDRAGTGRGMVAQRGYPGVANLHHDRAREAPLGSIFDIITHGFGRMPAYAKQIPVSDRWAIAAYLRALQVSQSPSPDDVTASRPTAAGGAAP